ncbi:MAG: BACON domain-containing protein [Chloroflexi bacterium]|nr:BACON domain-containing protein [Chloroflexota bacterium]
MPVAAPTLTLSPNIVSRGQVVSVSISRCQPLSYVFLSHDLREPLHIDATSSRVQVDPGGDATVRMQVDDSWKPGEHYIEAEDITTHSVFGAPLQVMGAGAVLPPLLQISQTSLDMGAKLQGGNTLQPLQMRNAGGGMIAWIAKSNQPWLMLSPTQGVFSDSQKIFIAATRADLDPGNYQGQITISSNTGVPVTVQVTMSVLPISVDAGAVLAVAPPLLSFAATDGGLDPAGQDLTVSNPGSKPLSWSIASEPPAVVVNQEEPLSSDGNWLSVQPPSGVVAPHATASVHVLVHSHALLASMYSSTLTFIADSDTLNNREAVAISLNVQQRCGVAANMSAMSFAVSVGQSKTQFLNLGITPDCSQPIPWEAFSLASWLTVTPNSGQVQPKSGVLTSVEVHAGQLNDGIYHGFIMFLTAQHIETVPVQLNVLSSSHPATASPVGNTSPSSNTSTSSASTSSTTGLSVSASDLSFTATQGQAGPGNQSVTLSNNGSSSLTWHATIVSSGASWLSISPSYGSLASGQSGQLVVNTATSQLGAGTYSAQISITPMDAAGISAQGSPLTISVTLNVLPSCSLQVAPSRLSFTTSLLQSSPPGQSITLKFSGACAQSVNWQASVDSNSSSWLTLSPSSGTDTGGGSIITVSVSASGSLLGGSSRSGVITITANRLPASSNSQTVSVILNSGL